jgi:hypothetical protein
MATGDVVEAVIRGICRAQEVINVLHFIQVDAAATKQDLFDHLNLTAIGPLARLLACFCNDYTTDKVAIRRVLPTLEAGATDFPWTMGSSAEGSAGYLGSSGLIKWVTTGSGRRARGRTFVGPLPQAGVIDGVVQPNDAARLGLVGTAIANAFWTTGPIYDGDWLQVVYSPTGATSNLVNGFSVRTDAVSQRRRNL